MKAYLLSLGCSKNLVDSETMIYNLEQEQIVMTNDEEDAELIIVNTCAFIGDAKEESIDSILALAQLKENKLQKLIVTGCLPQRYAEELLKEIPEIDGVIGTGRYEDVVELIRQLDEKPNQNLSFVDDILQHKIYKELPRVTSTPSHYAYLRIAEGCDHHCTYCIIPGIRGQYRSRKKEDILTEAQWLSQKGVKELIVIAEDISVYGMDLYGKNELVPLLKELAPIDGIERIRLLYVYPNHISDEFFDLMANEEKICNYIDMPIQHISDPVLKKMGRRITGDRIKEIIEKAREKVPGIVFRTSLIVGFPGETEEDFGALCDFVTEYKIERLGVFAYSREEDTPAYKLPDQIPEKIKLKRKDRIMKLQFKNVKEYNEAIIGKKIEVIVDDFDGIFFESRSCSETVEIDPVILVKYDDRIKIGDIIECTIVCHSDYDIIGEIESELTE